MSFDSNQLIQFTGKVGKEIGIDGVYAQINLIQNGTILGNISIPKNIPIKDLDETQIEEIINAHPIIITKAAATISAEPSIPTNALLVKAKATVNVLSSALVKAKEVVTSEEAKSIQVKAKLAKARTDVAEKQEKVDPASILVNEKKEKAMKKRAEVNVANGLVLLNTSDEVKAKAAAAEQEAIAAEQESNAADAAYNLASKIAAIWQKGVEDAEAVVLESEASLEKAYERVKEIEAAEAIAKKAEKEAVALEEAIRAVRKVKAKQSAEVGTGTGTGTVTLSKDLMDAKLAKAIASEKLSQAKKERTIMKENFKGLDQEAVDAITIEIEALSKEIDAALIVVKEKTDRADFIEQLEGTAANTAGHEQQKSFEKAIKDAEELVNLKAIEVLQSEKAKKAEKEATKAEKASEDAANMEEAVKDAKVMKTTLTRAVSAISSMTGRTEIGAKNAERYVKQDRERKKEMERKTEMELRRRKLQEKAAASNEMKKKALKEEAQAKQAAVDLHKNINTVVKTILSVEKQRDYAVNKQQTQEKSDAMRKNLEAKREAAETAAEAAEAAEAVKQTNPYFVAATKRIKEKELNEKKKLLEATLAKEAEMAKEAKEVQEAEAVKKAQAEAELAQAKHEEEVLQKEQAAQSEQAAQAIDVTQIEENKSCVVM
jgi:hypothetical protein